MGVMKGPYTITFPTNTDISPNFVNCILLFFSFQISQAHNPFKIPSIIFWCDNHIRKCYAFSEHGSILLKSLNSGYIAYL